MRIAYGLVALMFFGCSGETTSTKEVYEVSICPSCGAKLAQAGDRHDCLFLQELNRREGWIDGIYGGRRAESAPPAPVPAAPSGPTHYKVEDLQLPKANTRIQIAIDDGWTPLQSALTTSEPLLAESFERKFQKLASHYELQLEVRGYFTKKSKSDLIDLFHREHRGWELVSVKNADLAYERSLDNEIDFEAIIAKADHHYTFSMSGLSTNRGPFAGDLKENWPRELKASWSNVSVSPAQR